MEWQLLGFKKPSGLEVMHGQPLLGTHSCTWDTPCQVRTRQLRGVKEWES